MRGGLKIAAVVVHYDNWPVVLETVKSLDADPAVDEILLWDNGSGALDLEVLAREVPNVRVRESSSNLGYGAAMSRAVRSTGSDPADLVLLATHELQLAPGSLSEMVRVMDRDRAIAACGPVIHRRRAPEIAFSFGGVLSGRARRHKHLKSWDTAEDQRAVEWLDGSCVLARRAAFDHVGGFDEGYFLYFEDVAFGVSLRAHGWKLVVARDARALQDTGNPPLALWTRSRVRFARRVLGPVGLALAVRDEMLAVVDDLRWRRVRRAAHRCVGVASGATGCISGRRLSTWRSVRKNGRGRGRSVGNLGHDA